MMYMKTLHGMCEVEITCRIPNKKSDFNGRHNGEVLNMKVVA